MGTEVKGKLSVNPKIRTIKNSNTKGEKSMLVYGVGMMSM